jgi:hypothetical protein
MLISRILTPLGWLQTQLSFEYPTDKHIMGERLGRKRWGTLLAQ